MREDATAGGGLDAAGVAAALRALEGALASGDAGAAGDALVAVAGHPAVPAGSLDGVSRQVASWHLAARAWASASAVLDALLSGGGGADQDRQLRCFAGNMAAMEAARPGVYGLLLDWMAAQAKAEAEAEGVGVGGAGAPATMLPTVSRGSSCRLFRDGAGAVRMAQRDGSGGFTAVPPGARMDAFVEQTGAHLAGKDGWALGLLGVGDGQALTWLAGRRPALFMDMEVGVHVVEPDLDRLLLAMHLEDWSGADGPVRADRFVWHVGAGWAEAMASACLADAWLALPAEAVCPDGAVAEALGPAVKEVLAGLRAGLVERRSGTTARYAERGLGSFVDGFAGRALPGGRRPRMAVLTSRFTTVLQYAAADVASALERLGWEARLFKEPTRSSRFSEAVLVEVFDGFEPDALFTIDTPRSMIASAVPAKVPVLHWIQDALPRLMNRGVGRRRASVTLC